MIKAKSPKQVYSSLITHYKHPVFIEGFLYGGLAIAIFGLILSLT